MSGCVCVESRLIEVPAGVDDAAIIPVAMLGLFWRSSPAITAEISGSIATGVIEKAGYVLDLHCGGGNGWLRPYVYQAVTGQPQIGAASASFCQWARTFGQGHGAGAHTIQDGTNPLAVDFDGDGTLQQADGDYEAINLVRAGDRAFHACQGAALDVHSGADTEKRPRPRRKPRTKDNPDGLDLFIVNWDRGFAEAHDAYHAGGSQNGQAVAHIKSTEQITWEKREIELFHPVGPTTPTATQRQVRFVSLAAQRRGGDAPLFRLDLECVPRQITGPAQGRTPDRFESRVVTEVNRRHYFVSSSVGCTSYRHKSPKT